MIIDLRQTTTSRISKELITVREQAGVYALTRVLTLIISCRAEDLEDAIAAANSASNEHPMRIIAVVDAQDNTGDHLDGQIRVGSDAGASEVIVLHAYGQSSEDPESLVTGLLLPDAPVVVWWPGQAPDDVANSALGRLAQRRITDAYRAADPRAALAQRRRSYAPGDTDLAWTRLTGWRTQIATALARVWAGNVEAIRITGAMHTPSIELLATWLHDVVACPVKLRQAHPDSVVVIVEVCVTTAQGDFTIAREGGSDVVRVQRPGTPIQRVLVPRRSLSDCLAEELRTLAPDQTFGAVLAAWSSDTRDAQYLEEAD